MFSITSKHAMEIVKTCSFQQNTYCAVNCAPLIFFPKPEVKGTLATRLIQIYFKV